MTLRLLYGKPSSEEQSKGNWAEPEWGDYCAGRYINLAGTELHWHHGVLGHSADADLIVVEQASKLLVNYAISARSLAKRGQRVALWGHGKNIAASTSKLGEAIKRPYTNRADWFFAYTESTKRLMIERDYPESRITVVQNAVDTHAIRSGVDSLMDDQLAGWRDRHGISTDAKLALALGSLYADKRPSFLIEAADAAHEADPAVEFVIAGSGPDAAIVDEAARTRPWLHAVGPVFGTDKAAALASASCMVMPGVGGLVIVDAFAAGLPLVMCENPYHPPEFDYVQDGYNSMVLGETTSAEEFGNATVALLADPGRLARLADGSRADGEVYTIQAMVDRFADGVLAALGRR
ncbi:MAG: glycosyltransferase family 4 protein [Acidimicrobiales bacterium]